jgi:superfamily II DNA or RNA helicase
MNPLWPAQEKAIRLVNDVVANGHRRICLCLPIGGGKSRVICELVRDFLHVGFNVSVYTNRRMLIDQLSRVFSEFGMNHGVRSADALECGKVPTGHPLQVSSIQTEASRMLRKKTWQLHPADRVFIGEAHLNADTRAKNLMDLHLEQNPGRRTWDLRRLRWMSRICTIT